MAQRFRAYHKASSKTFDLKRNDKTFLLSIFLPLFVIKAVFVIANATGPSIISDEYIYKFNAESLFLLQKYANAHYPPMYPLALAPAFAIERWYECMLVINAFISSLIVPAVWFLARSIGMNNPRVPAVLAALIPFHAVYPGFLLGENLFVPLFCLTLALAVRGDKASTQEGALFGAVLGMTHLTKYLFLPAIPLLYLAWLYAAYGLREKGDDRGLVHALSPALSYALVIGIWIWYGLHSGFDWRQMFGLDISTAGRLITNSSAIAHELEKHSRPAALLKWAAAYASFIVLAWMPTWGLAAAWLTQAKPNGHDGDKSDRKSRIFIILLALLIAGFCAIATLHSFGAKYNATQPTKIMGRYLAQLAPPMLVLATFFLESLSHMEIRLRTRKFAFASAFMTAIFSLSWWVIAQGGVWDFPKFFYKNQVNLLDVSIFGKFGYLPLGIGTIIVPLLMVSPSGRRQALLAAPLGAFLLCFSLGYARMAPFHSEGMNLRMIVNAAASPEYRGKEIRVITDKSRPQPKALQGAAQFWGLDEISLIPQEIPQETDSWSTLKGQCLLLTTHQFQFPAVNAFSFKEKNFFIYGITENNLEAIKAYFATAEEGELP